MTKALLFSIFLLLSLSSLAQKIQFSNKDNIWHEQGGTTGDEITRNYSRFFYNGDSTINSVVYQKLYRQFGSEKWLNIPVPGAPLWSPRTNGTKLFALIREDISVGVVYIQIDGKDSILYDYNRQQGDSFLSMGGAIHKVLQIDTIQINGTGHRVWKYSINSKATYTVIEGIGATTGSIAAITQPLDHAPFESGSNLFCFRTSTGKPLLSKSVEGFDNSKSCELSVSESATDMSRSVRVVPNPANNSAYIQLPANLQNADILIYNIQGQVMFRSKPTGRRIFVGDKLPSSGMYFYTITDTATGYSTTGKFLFNN